MLRSSLGLGTVAGIRIGVHYTWIVIFAFLSFSLYSWFMYDHRDWVPLQALTTAVITAILFFASIVLHELGHSIVAIRRGIPVASITLFIFGGVAHTERDADSAATEFWVAIAGPLVSFGLAIVFYVLGLTVGRLDATVSEALGWLASINLFVGLFNLIPGFPLDGGRVFRALVWGLSGNAVKGMRWAVFSGKFVAYGLMAGGVLIVLNTGLWLNGLWLAAIGWFLLAAAESGARAFRAEHLAGGIRVEEVMQHEVPAVPADISIEEWLDRWVAATNQRAFLVYSGDRLLGLVSLDDRDKLERTRWVAARVEAIMTPAEKLLTVSPNTDIAQALRLMRRHSIDQVPVMDGGQPVGWVDRESLLRVVRQGMAA